MREESTSRKISITSKQAAHADCVSCLGWSGNNELLTFGDDRNVLKFSAEGELSKFQTNLFDTPTVKPGSDSNPSLYVTEMHWFPSTGKAQANSEIFVLGGSDGLKTLR
jgi:hypothetical protein